MSTTAWALAEVEDLESFVGDDRNTYPDEFERIIEQISAYMERFTQRKLKARAYDYSVAADKNDAIGDGDGSPHFFTKQWPINSVTTLIVGDTTLSAGSWDDTSGYIVYNNEGRIYYEYGFDRYKQNVFLVYNAGYASGTSEYDELNLICCLLTQFIWDNKDRLGLKQEFLGRYRYTRGNFADTDKWIWEALNSYRRSVFSR